MTLKEQIKKLPDSPGIYQFYDKEGKLLYVGKSVSVKKRVASYFRDKNLGTKTDLMVQKIAQVDFIKVFSEFEALLLEAELIRKYLPFFNSIAKDDKSPIYIKVTNDQIPLITLERKRNLGAACFTKGPFPQAKVARSILKMIRRIFPYCHHKNPKKPCLYVHLGLCPFPYRKKESPDAYKKTIGNIKKLLSGQIKSLMAQLSKEMNTYAKIQNYERAAVVKKQIEKLQYLTTTYHAPPEFLEQPTLVDDLTQARLRELQSVLGLAIIPRRIECYDISNIQGNLAVGSMVVFTGGQPDKAQYRKFKIKFVHKPNDYQMIREVIARRAKNDWPVPDLMIIDGGRGQLNAARSQVAKYKQSFSSNKVKTFVAALAKRFDQIYCQNRVLPISLPKESPARLLAQQIRDEAHRFAITYHRLLRLKKLLGT